MAARLYHTAIKTNGTETYIVWLISCNSSRCPDPGSFLIRTAAGEVIVELKVSVAPPIAHTGGESTASNHLQLGRKRTRGSSDLPTRQIAGESEEKSPELPESPQEEFLKVEVPGAG
jgi:hypothetical protein